MAGKDWHIADSFITLNLRNNYDNIFVSAFSGYIIVGSLSKEIFTKKRSIQIPILKLTDFVTEVYYMFEFFIKPVPLNSSEKDVSFILKQTENQRWNRQVTKGISNDLEKKVTLFNNSEEVLKMNVNDFIYFISTLLNVGLHTFIFEEVQLKFFQIIISDRLYYNYETETFSIEKSLEFAVNYFSDKKCNLFTLEKILRHHANEFQQLCILNTLAEDLKVSSALKLFIRLLYLLFCNVFHLF